MTLVVDASVVVAAFTDPGEIGDWARDLLRENDLSAPHLMPAEVTNILRRSVQHGDLSVAAASAALNDALATEIELYAFEGFADRIWQMRGNITSYDAWYVALAEVLGVPLATIDGPLTRASGPRCQFLTPESRGSQSR